MAPRLGLFGRRSFGASGGGFTFGEILGHGLHYLRGRNAQ
jgi:hypothetical protein